MATLGSLNIGDYVYDPRTYRIDSQSSPQGDSKGNKRAYQCIKWRVIGKNVDRVNSVTLCADVYGELNIGITFDSPEPTNPNSDKAEHGNSNYKLSNVLQWLNSDASSDWYVSQHSYDAPPTRNANRPGLMYSFSSNLKNALMLFQKSFYDIESGSTQVAMEKKVQMLALSEIIGKSKSEELGYRNEGTQYEYYANRVTETNFGYNAKLRTANSVSKIVTSCGYTSYNQTYDVETDYCGGNTPYYTNPVIVLPSDTLVSNNKYKSSATTSGTGDWENLYAMLTMPLIIDISGVGNVTSPNLTTRLTYKIYDDNASIASFKIAVDRADNVVYSTTNIVKGQEYTFDVDCTEYEINEQHDYLFIAVDSNGETVTEIKSIKRYEAVPIIKIYDEEKGEWTNGIHNTKEYTKPPIYRIKISDADELSQNMYVYIAGSAYQVYNFIGTYTSDQEIECRISDSVWKNFQNDYIGPMYVWVTNREAPLSTSYGTNVSAGGIRKKVTPPYVSVDSTDIGRKNIAFNVTYTPNTDTVQALTNVSIYLDDTDTLLQSIDNPTAGSQLTYAVTKADLDTMTMGSHKLIFTVEDDLSQTGTSEVTFTKYNNAPNVISDTNIGNKNVGFTFSFSVSDDEGDISSVKAYIDSTTGTPVKTWNNVASGSNLSHEITKNDLYGLSIGIHKIYVVAEDAYGSTTADITFTRYNDAPAISLSQETTVHDSDFDISYRVTDSENDTTNIVFKIGNREIASVSDVDLDTILTQEILVNGLPAGQNTLTAIATDSQGNATTQTLVFNISTTPVITADEISDKAEPFNVSFMVDDEDGDDLNVEVKLDATRIFTQVNAPHNTVINAPVSSTIFNNLTYGVHIVTIVVVDSNNVTATKELPFRKCSIPSVRIVTDIPHEIDGEFSFDVEYDNADGSEVTIKAYINGQEIIQ